MLEDEWRIIDGREGGIYFYGIKMSERNGRK
jgi:hypothetical protein